MSRLRKIIATEIENIEGLNLQPVIQYQLTDGNYVNMVIDMDSEELLVADQTNKVILTETGLEDQDIKKLDKQVLERFNEMIFLRYVTLTDAKEEIQFPDHWLDYVKANRDTLNEQLVKGIENAYPQVKEDNKEEESENGTNDIGSVNDIELEDEDKNAQEEIGKVLQDAEADPDLLTDEEINELLNSLEPIGEDTREEVEEELKEIQQVHKEDESRIQKETKLNIQWYVVATDKITDRLFSKYDDTLVPTSSPVITASRKKRSMRKFANLGIKTNNKLYRKVIEAASWNSVSPKLEGNVVNLATYYPQDNQTNTAFVAKNLDTGVYYAVDSNEDISGFKNFSQAENQILGNNPEPIFDREVTQDGYDDGNVANSQVWQAFQFNVQQKMFQQNLENLEFRDEKGIPTDYQYNEQSFVEYMEQNPPKNLDDVKKLAEEAEKYELDAFLGTVSIDFVLTATDEEKSTFFAELETLKNEQIIFSYLELV